MSTARIDLARVPVGDVMSRGVVTCPPESSARVVAETMATKGIHCVVVTDMLEEEGGVRGWGVISDLDLATVAVGEVDELTAAEIAVTEPLMIQATDSLEQASQQMVEHQVAHVLVVKGEPPRPVGVLSTLDLARVLAGKAQLPPLVATTGNLERLSELAWAFVDPLGLHKAEHRRWSASLHADYGYGPPFHSMEGLRRHLEAASEPTELRPNDVPLRLIALLIAFFAAHPDRHEAGRRLLADALREAFAGAELPPDIQNWLARHPGMTRGRNEDQARER